MAATLEQNMAVYAEERERLEAEHMDEWVLIYDQNVICTSPDFEEIARRAAREFDRGPYHIRRVGERPPAVLLRH